MDINKRNSILIIDDSKTEIAALSAILEEQGYIVYTAENGWDGIETAEKYEPDVILLDIIMPGKDGYSVLTTLKSTPKTQNIPVIFLTGLTTFEGEAKGLKLGAADYINKPFSPAVIKLRIENQLKISHHKVEYDMMRCQLENSASQRALANITSVLNNAEAIIYANDINTYEIVFITDYTKEHFGLKGDVLGKPCYEVFQDGKKGRCDFCPRHQLDKEPDKAVVWEEHNPVTNRYYRKTDRYIDWPNGKKVHIQYATDLTDIRQKIEEIEYRDKLLQKVNEELTETNNRARMLLDSTPMCCQLFNSAYKKIDCNQEALRLFGFKTKEIFLLNSTSVYPEFQPDGQRSMEKITKLLDKAVKEGSTGIFEWTYELLDGTIVPTEALVVKIPYGDDFMLAGYTRDLREYKRIMEALEEALIQAEAGSKAKGDFLSTMSHEIRTPMNAIIGMTAIGKKSRDSKEKDYALTKIEDASTHLLGIINDILDIAKIEANKMELSPIEFEFEKMLTKVIGISNFRIEEKKQTLSVDIDKRIPNIIFGDEQRLTQVITNLMSNATKFTPDGGKIHLEATLVSERNGNCEIRISITDSGIGLSAEQHERMFQAFEQADSGISRQYGGTGLGLVISKRIVELMNGKIWVDSELGKGSKFVFTIKVQHGGKNEKPDQKKIEVEEAHSGEFAGKTMLFAEDVEVNREILIALLEDTGITIECAVNGVEAVEMVKKNPAKYDIVFMDVQMPKMSGLEATRCIRALPSVTKRRNPLPIIATTANVFKSDIEECINAGMDGHLGKPLDFEKVLEILRKYLV